MPLYRGKFALVVWPGATPVRLNVWHIITAPQEICLFWSYWWNAECDRIIPWKSFDVSIKCSRKIFGSDRISWQWCFYIKQVSLSQTRLGLETPIHCNLPMGVLAVLVVSLFYEIGYV